MNASVLSPQGDTRIFERMLVIYQHNHGKGDRRIFLQGLHCSTNGFKEVNIITVDTDVFCHSTWMLFSIKTRWVEFGAGRHRRWLPIHTYAHLLGERICMAVPFWFAFSDSLFVSRKRKKTTWNVWNSVSQGYPVLYQFI